MGKYPISKDNIKKEDKFISKKGEFELHKEGKKLSEDEILKLVNKENK